MGKVIGYFLIIAIFVGAAYYLAVGKNVKKVEEEKEEATPSAEIQSQTTKISVFAAGTAANGEFPTMTLKIDNNTVQTWTGVQGNPKNGEFDEFTYNYVGEISGQLIQVGFINDLYIAADEDRNLYVDRIVVGDKTYVADSPATLTTITDKDNRRCSDGNTYSRWLLCNGYFTFQPYETAFIPAPTLPARMITGTMIKVFAAGTFAGGDYPIFDLNIRGKKVASFKVAGNPAARILGEYDYLTPDKVNISDISILYTNDFYSDDRAGNIQDRNLYIDRIELDGVDYPGDGFSVYQTGVWKGDKCMEGYLRSKLLWCPGATMRFGARLTPTPIP